MKKITKKFLKEHNACREGYEWYLEQNTENAGEIFKRLISQDRLDDANWVICRMFNRKQKIQYAVYAAEQVLEIFENKYPDDKRPRQAIEAAKKVLKSDTTKNRNANSASANAAYAAASAYDAANAASAANAKKEMKTKILKYGLKLLKIEV
jgi:thioredoxin-like negative regulator of GroEL